MISQSDQRPPPLVFRKRTVCRVVGCSPAHLDRLRAVGDFPAAIKLGAQAIGWHVRDIEAWLASRPTTSN